MKRSLFLSVIIAIPFLSSCNTLPMFDTDKNDESTYTYTNLLEKPSEKITNIDELEAIVDYYAFYKTTTFTLDATEYTYSVSGEETFERELNYLYWHSELVNGVMGMYGTNNDGMWTINFVKYKNASIGSTRKFDNASDIFYNVNANKVGNKYESYFTDDESKPLCDVATTQQLWYAAEHDYKVNPLPGSPAEKYYNKSKQLLDTLVTDGMTKLEKSQAIYDYIETHITYDYNGLELSESHPVENPQLFPDEYCAQQKCYFIEGFFDDRTVVCDGFSKIYTLLGKMAGIDIVRASGTNDTSWDTREVFGHAYNFVKYDENDTWYLCCPTWGQISNNQYLPQGYVYNHHYYFMTAHAAINPYMSTEWTNLNISNMYTIYNTVAYNRSIKVGDDTITSNVENLEMLNKVCDAVKTSSTKQPYAEVLVEESLYSQVIHNEITLNGVGYYYMHEAIPMLIIYK